MTVRVKLFAAARELAGRDELAIDVPPRVTIADLRQALIGRFPPLATIALVSLWAIDTDYATDSDVVREHSEVAMIPPVSGG